MPAIPNWSTDRSMTRCSRSASPCVKDIPQEHFNALIAKASEVVFEKLTASNPDAVYEVHKVLTDITGQEPAGQPKAKRDYREAAAQFDIVRRSGAPVDPVVCDYAKNGKFEETVAALSALCGAPTKLVESVMNDARPESDFHSFWQRLPACRGRPSSTYAFCAVRPLFTPGD